MTANGGVFFSESILNSCTGKALALIGFIFLSYEVLRVVLYVAHVIKTFYLSRWFGLHVQPEKLGTWAVVTGSTSGIGKAYAEQLACKGMSIVLVSRNPEKLKEVESEIASKYRVPTKTIVIDLTTTDLERYQAVSDELQPLDIGVLVNNAGMASGLNRLVDTEGDRQKKFADVINVNAISLTLMTDIVLPGMLKRRRGAIINISSYSAFVPFPALAVYSSTKAYVDFFTRALQTEYISSGVIFQVVLPFFVSSNMSKMKPSRWVPSSTDYVKSALNALGNEGRTAGCMLHEILRLFATSLPEEWCKRVSYSYAMKMKKSASKQKDK